MPKSTVPATTGVATAALAVALTATVVARAHGGGPPTAPADRQPLSATSTVVGGGIEPGGVVTGTVEVRNRGEQPRRVSDVVFAAPTSQACRRTGLALAPTVPPTPELPLRVPARGTATLGWTAYMDGEGDHACQGAPLRSAVLLGGEPAGVVRITAGELELPPAPTGGLTTSTRAAVRWSPSTAADPGWVVERAVAGTTGWQPACGSSPQRPVRELSCTDTGLRAATAYVYRVTLRTGHWHATSRPSRPVTTQDRPSA